MGRGESVLGRSQDPTGPQALRGDQIENSSLQGRGKRLKFTVMRSAFQCQGCGGFRWPRNQRGMGGLKGNNQGETGKGQNWVTEEAGSWTRKDWKPGKDVELGTG